MSLPAVVPRRRAAAQARSLPQPEFSGGSGHGSNRHRRAYPG